MDVSHERITRVYEQVTSSIDELLGMLEDEDWSKPTDCPAWTVKDILAHLSSFEAIAAGTAEHAAEADVSAYEYATGFNETIEKDIESRRTWEPKQLVDEFREATLKRAAALKELDEDSYPSSDLTLPFGVMPHGNMMPIRIIDLYFHEQDIRRATSHPGHLDGETARLCFERMRAGLPAILGKRVGVSGDQTVVFNLTSHAGETLSFGVNDQGRVQELSETPTDPTVRILTDLEHFLMLTGGRGNAEDHLADGSIRIDGDREIGRKILASMAVTP